MTFTSPFPKAGHNVFEYTFLQGVSLELAFRQVRRVEDYWPLFKAFAKDEFNLDIPDKPKQGNAEIASAPIETKFVFNYESGVARLVVGHKGYDSFGVTMTKRIGQLVSFLRDVAGVEDVDKIVLKKSNVFPIGHKDGNFNVKDVFNFVFKSDSVGEIDNAPSGQGEVVKVSKESKVDIGAGASLLFTVGYVIKSRTQVDLFLELSSEDAPAGGVALDCIFGRISEINDVLDDAFLYMVTNNVTDVMRGGVKNV